jgi:predicted Zn-dependent protease with MMP-like domain
MRIPWLTARREANAHRRRLTLAAEAWELVPDHVRDACGHVRIMVRDKPNDLDMRRHGIPAHVAGVFVEAGDDDPDQDRPAGEPARRHGVIVLYLGNCTPRTPRGVADVLTHEMQHAMGHDGHDVEACR